jgi:hypothetical protein
MKYLIAFGCSFTYGDELLDPALVGKEDCCARQNDDYRNSHSYPGILARHYGLELINTAFPGASLESERYALDWLLHKTEIDITECMIIAGHTQAHRMSWYDPDFDDGGFNALTHSAWHKTPERDSEWFNLSQLWYKKSHACPWEEYSLRQTNRLFNSVKWEQGIPVIQFKAFDNEPTVADLPDFTFQSIAGNNLKPHGHPDEKGHQLFADHLINYIDRVILHEC